MSALSENIVADWEALLGAESDTSLAELSLVVNRHSQVLADHFYQVMMEDESASVFLSHDQVRHRLHGSMKTWLERLCTVDEHYDMRAVIAQQIKVGEIHARIDVPVHLVLRGARTLKDRFRELLGQAVDVPVEDHRHCFGLFCNLMDLAMEMMSQAYAVSHDRKARTSEAYRLFSISQNLSTEREKQKAALLDWENSLMFDSAMGIAAHKLPRIEDSEFGLWFRHKGAHAFQGAAETDLIMEAMAEIDHVLLPLFNLDGLETLERVEKLREIRGQAKGIHYQLETLFDQSMELESGKDVLTRLLNRKFLPAVLTREVQFCRKSNRGFAALLVDIDHFKNVNDRYGHESGDLVLQQVATHLTNSCRSGDFLFRMGGEEFLIILVDIKPDSALRVAEQMRTQLAADPLLLPNNQKLNITASMGLALYDGHPDYQRILRKADDALYQAKNGGRNQVCVAE
ncbi:GGDEF domain-containing protein [Marinobacter sp. CA1]|uniref:GGDEF domain-containing protein n=1 Tax=Marinobacter sp. CA1 TaxID=2817656 RepID=UPI001D05C37C|nr:GGDEF domain-containing protein [Marinobacter sp. CA1]UDL05824.1 GGDEF domain-containing protein [Marinobacter sp. CA1]